MAVTAPRMRLTASPGLDQRQQDELEARLPVVGGIGSEASIADRGIGEDVAEQGGDWLLHNPPPTGNATPDIKPRPTLRQAKVNIPLWHKG
jgi:hypothetical protein